MPFNYLFIVWMMNTWLFPALALGSSAVMNVVDVSFDAHPCLFFWWVHIGEWYMYDHRHVFDWP